jgi:alkaline phosphatase D
VWTDAWDGYPLARDRLLRLIDDNQLRSCVVLSGDTHANYVCDLLTDFDDPQSDPVATELCGTSVTSPGGSQAHVEAVMRDNPHILFGDARKRGYVVVDVTAERSTARLRVVEDVTDPGTAVATQATFAVDAGRPGAQPLSE